MLRMLNLVFLAVMIVGAVVTYDMKHKAEKAAERVARLEARIDRERVLSRAIEIAKTILEQDGADTLVLGCMSMAFQDMAQEMSQRLGVPVINPLHASMAVLQFMVRTKTRQSRLIYKL